MKNIAQKRWIKGLVATIGAQSQPPGSLQRMSNLLYNKRGSLVPCDGSALIAQLNGAFQFGTGPWTDIALFQPTNTNRYYIGLKKDFTKHLGTPANVVAADGGAGGTLPAETVFYKVTGVDGAGGETLMGVSGSFTNPGAHKVNITWNALTNAISYNVYVLVSPDTGGGHFIINVTTNSFTDDGSHAPAGALTKITADTTQQMVLYVIASPSYGDANIIKLYPADLFPYEDGTPGGGGGGGGTTNPSAGAPPNASGGLLGNVGPVPQILQFANKAILALGNAFAPQAVTDGAPPTAAALTNSFTTAYPNWITATPFLVGDVILPTAGNAGNFVFKATQSGTSGAGAPTWPQTPNQIVADGKIIWQNTGVTNANVAPRGAAHIEVYAGSLWVLNTSPTTTADNLDGPSALAMSDTNNPNSWNPLNRAFLDRDDGDVGMGLKAYTVAESGIPPTGSLVAFKNFKTFQITGVFGASDFSLQQAQTDMGCVASRSIQFLPGFGIARLAHLGIAIFDGTRDKLISEDIRPYLFTDLQHYPDIQALDWNLAYLAKGGQVANPPMYALAIPLALVPFPVNAGFGNLANMFTQVAANTFTNPATYFFRIYKMVKQPSGVFNPVAISKELTFLIPDGNTVLFVQGVEAVNSANKYRVYFGAATGAYTSFAEFTSAQFIAGQTLTGPGSFPNAGSVDVGTGGLTRILCYDLVQKNWCIIDLPFSIEVLKQVRAPGIQPLTVVGSFNDGSVQRIQAGDLSWAAGSTSIIIYSAQLPEISGDSGTERVFHRRVLFTGTATPNAQGSMLVTINADGVQRTDLPTIQITAIQNAGAQAGQFIGLQETLINVLRLFATISGQSTDGSVVIDGFDQHVEPQPQGAPPIFS